MCGRREWNYGILKEATEYCTLTEFLKVELNETGRNLLERMVEFVLLEKGTIVPGFLEAKFVHKFREVVT